MDVDNSDRHNLSPLRHIEAVLFDLDDTILDRERSFSLYCDYVINVIFPDDMPAKEKSGAKEFLIENDKHGYESRERFYKKIIDHWRLPFTIDYFLSMWDTHYYNYIAPESGLHDNLAFLAQNYKLGIITNGAVATQNRKIDALGVRKYFQTIIISEEVGMKKPEKGIFMRACQEIQVDAPNAVFIGDNFDNDIIGATQAGLSAIWLNKAKIEKPFINQISELSCIKDKLIEMQRNGII